jgi:hypothetical protein
MVRHSGPSWETALARSKKEAPFNDPNLVAWTERHLCRPPGGGGSNFFLSVYANTVRSLSLVHCLFFALVLALPLEIARIGASIFLVDLVLFLGSAQISPMALACTSLLWVRRGPVVPAIPYKVKCRKNGNAGIASVRFFKLNLTWHLVVSPRGLMVNPCRASKVVFVFYIASLYRVVSGMASITEVIGST